MAWEPEENINTEPEENEVPETEISEAAPEEGTAVSSNESGLPSKKPTIKVKGKKIGKRFSRIPASVLFSPGGVVLIFFALIMEIIDLVPVLEIDNLTWELVLEGIFAVAYVGNRSCSVLVNDYSFFN
jgi:hypothetical protein